ncbi:OsmC family protein [Pelagibacterium lentulum]|uniref:ABC transporter ATP-binding protein n=1 Tax=Pelagibacterium lentulum TaxID=2029865 RepID=A0A916W3F1_9HYPH|nr:OsmC family protein [Pelagibacterium lentulum]GGA63212.1 ABC transporter ATP-binding protein [Pelagibacterium lentulum]
MVKITTRSATVGAWLGGTGRGRITAHSGTSVDLAGLATDEGLTPLEFMDAALAGCLVLSVRIAARKFGWGNRLTEVAVDVTHTKAADEPSRVERFACSFAIEGDFTSEERQQLIDEAHAICTVGNTFERGAQIIDVEAK